MASRATRIDLQLPVRLLRLIASGWWPGTDGPSMNAQQSTSLVDPGRVKLFAAEETVICLERPPFRTIAELRAEANAGNFWETCAALDQIDPDKALVIGNFGMGSDAPIVLDYAHDPADPPVLRLRWRSRLPNDWGRGRKEF